MKAKITAKSELRLSDLSREYTFDIIEGDTIVLSSQAVNARPSEIVNKLEQIVQEYELAYNDENDLDIGEEV